MLVVEPDRRYSLRAIIKHRWLSDWVSEMDDFNPAIYETATYIHSDSDKKICKNAANESATSIIPTSIASMTAGAVVAAASTTTSPVPNLDSVVMTHMLQLPGLTADMIAQSVHEKRFDNIYAIYNLLYDKLQQKRREQQRLQHHANLAFSR